MPTDGTRLTRAEYLSAQRRDEAAIAQAAADHLERAVPTCPGWSLADLLLHVGGVYAHKAAAVTTGRRPEPGEWSTAPGEGEDLLAWFTAQGAAMRAAVFSAEPATPTWTWWPPDQTVGFWQRRMAQETAVHRVDAELARGSAAPVPAALAADGCDEVIGWLAGSFPDPADATGGTVRIDVGQHEWTVRLPPAEVAGAGGPGPADAVVSGPAPDVLMWLWGRPGGDVTMTGDPAAVAVLRERLGTVTG